MGGKSDGQKGDGVCSHGSKRKHGEGCDLPGLAAPVPWGLMLTVVRTEWGLWHLSHKGAYTERERVDMVENPRKAEAELGDQGITCVLQEAGSPKNIWPP